MNFLKSVFVPMYMMGLMGITFYAGWRLAEGANPLAWIGVLLTTGPFFLVLAWVMLVKNVARTSARFPFLILLGAIGCGLAFLADDADHLASKLAAAGWMGFLVYSFWYSSYGRSPSEKLKAGTRLPDFTLQNSEGSRVSSAMLTSKPSILIFFRGNWCPFCMAQARELAARYNELGKLGVRVAMIAPQPLENTQSLARKFGAAIDFYTDEDNAAARTLGIAQAWGVPMGMQMLGYDSETVLPTVIITGLDGKVIWVHETDNYRVRPEPDIYLDILRQHGLTFASAA